MLKRLKLLAVKLLGKRSFQKNDKIVNSNYCPVCDNEVVINSFPYDYYFKKFYEHGFVHSPFLFETLNLKDYTCNTCGAVDRDRLIALYIKKYVNENNETDLKLLDFAPAKSLRSFLKQIDAIDYRSADLYMSDVDDIVDIRHMEIYDDQSFDMFVCSHVLEHIDDDLKAMSELHRILKKNGVGLVLVPILLSLETSIENKEYLESEHLRWKYFGQDDHVRQYSKLDFTERLKSCGFEVEQLGVDYFSDEVFDNCGIDKKSVLYVVRPKND